MISEDKMSARALSLVYRSIEEAGNVILKHKPKRKSMIVNGETVHSEEDLFNMYAADYFDSSKYDKLRDKFERINKDNIQADKDFEDAREYISFLLTNVRSWLKDAKEKEKKNETE